MCSHWQPACDLGQGRQSQAIRQRNSRSDDYHGRHTEWAISTPLSLDRLQSCTNPFKWFVVRLWTKSCPLCIFHNTSRIHFIFAHLIKQLQKVCCVKGIVKFQNLKFWQIFGICNFDFVLLWHGIWYESIIWVIMGQQGVFSECSCSSLISVLTLCLRMPLYLVRSYWILRKKNE